MLLRDTGRRAPLIVVFTAMCMGILIHAKDMVSVTFCISFLLLLFSKERFAHLAIGAALGYGAVLLAPSPVDIPDGDHQIQGTVREAGFMHGTYKVILDDVLIDHKPVNGSAQLNIYENVCDLKHGVSLKGPVRLTIHKVLGNPGEFNRQRYLLSEGITVSGYIKDLRDIEITGSGSSNSIKKRMTTYLASFARPEAEILNASITGDRSGLVYSLQDGFSSLGITHLIAISGLNMGVVFILGYSISFMILRTILPMALRFDTPFIAKIAGLACVILYTLFVGYSPPTARAAIMVFAFILSLAFARKANMLESLALSGIIILIWMPYSLFSASFLLSFSAVLGISGMNDLMETCPKWFAAIIIPVVSMAFTAPIIVSLFGFVSPLSIPANLVFVPLFSFIIMPLGAAGLAASFLSDQTARLILSLAFHGIGLILKAGETFGSLQPVPYPGVSWVLISYLGLITAFFARASMARSVLVTGTALFIIAIPVASHVSINRQPLCFDFISVGQGDSVIVSKGANAILIDAGSSFQGSDVGRFVIGPHLLRRGITHLDIAIMTHTHPDHIGGMPFILRRFPTGKIWYNYKSEWNPDFQYVTRIAKKKSITMKAVCLDDIDHLGGMKIEVLNPPRRIMQDYEYLDHNLQSLVMRVSDATMKGLFMGDAGGLGEIRMCRLDRDISADVLKVAHHGSKKSCLEMFLARVKPRTAVISLGKRNIYHLPHRYVLDRLKENGISVYRTDLDGNIQITAKVGKLQVKSGLNQADITDDSMSGMERFFK